MHPNPRRIAPIILIVIVAIAAWWFISRQKATAENGQLAASGTIEATEVLVSAELNGRVLEVLAQEGDSVQAGQVLVRFDSTLLAAQLKQAQTALTLASANYALVAAGPTEEQRQSAIKSAELELVSAQQALNDLHDNASLTQAAVQQVIANAKKAVDNASDHVSTLEEGNSQADIDSAWATVVLAKNQLDNARDDFKPYENKPEDNLTRAALQSKLAAAQKLYDNAVTRYNNIKGAANTLDMNQATANLAVAQAQLADAERQYAKLQDGIDPDKLALAESRLATAQAHLTAAQADPSAEQLDVAKKQVESAQAAVEVIQAQMDKLVLVAPVQGVVLTRSIEPGEMALPGTPLLTLARLDSLTITVFVPEDRYGAISLGEAAAVTVDSFPGATFTGAVIHIADRAEFTPRNVQTEQGRRSTVFAVKLTIDNPEGKLKAGMPADVLFK
jgi:multidrug resistance efflux pump